MYAIVDIETTGSGLKGNKITEISIFRHNGTTVVDEFTSLVNPQSEIPYYITALTGIDNQMVANAPTFREIAKKVMDMTEGAVFVAHSVNFDYNVIKYELEGLGISFLRKKLCTVRLSRKLFPGHNSYSLGKLCSALQIPLHDRHRARGDAQATVVLFEKLLNKDGAELVFKKFLNARSREATLPPLLPKTVVSELPDEAGIYYFKNANGKIIYVGKAINIKKRVLGHFYDRSDKEVRMCREIANIDFELSGSELLALLMESAAIKHYFPLYNEGQKRPTKKYGLFSYEDRKGILHLAFNNLKNIPNPLITFFSLRECRSFMQELCADFQLCPKYCHLQENVSSCSHYSIKRCKGVCREEESPEEYNARVLTAISNINKGHDNYLIREDGRTPDEDAVVLIKEGVYAGYGFVDKSIAINSLNDLEAYIQPQKDNPDIQRILRSYTSKSHNHKRVFYKEIYVPS
ncbi:GIY-YIG nuclease family protein [Leptobacterium flavescens]|uniref:GIY-YIG nuclease family protein n=1 Tax=Leptobacterium flavescens TaxID=472055 RepID=A0A6P0UNY4_9FLAO|nr:exonuclease domain-containing protein [Leptobacterium flavescens]NER13638.1 GIY-YIG nuclease family protein [Leptobacterium flavescens]